MKTLLLNSSYEVLSFISERKAIRLLVKGKAEVISTWNESIKGVSGEIIIPSILKMNYLINRRKIKVSYSRISVFKRDNFTCQYCSKKLNLSNITVDHIIPKNFGGENSFTNCVSACHACNAKKGDKFLNEIGMKLLKTPTIPHQYQLSISHDEKIHPEWKNFILNF